MTLKPIPQHPSYSVSENGEIYGPTLAKLAVSDRNGYSCVSLWVGKRKRKFKVSRLMAAAFLGLKLEDTTVTVDHVDSNKLNDSVANLRLLSIHENILHKHGRLGVDTDSHKKCSVCETLKSRHDFGISSVSRDGLKSQCKLCIKEIRKVINDRRSK